MKTLQELMSLNELNKCAYECTKQSRWKETTQRYLCNLLINNINLQDDVLGDQYVVQQTTDFLLNERGRIRKIEAPVTRDRVVQKSITKNVLIPSVRPFVMYDNYASLKMRGTSFARKRFEIMLRRYYAKNGIDGYILLIDIKKYFEHISHDVLKQLITPRIQNEPEDVIELIYYMIDTSSHSENGINLGSEAPQIFAVYYLNPLDIYMKVVRKEKYYGRYMDDIFIIGKSKIMLELLLKRVENILHDLKLEINKRKTHIVKLTHGFTFLQIKYNILPSGKILKRLSHDKIVRERKRLKAFKRKLDKGEMTENDIWNCYQSWRGTVIRDHNACYKTIKNMDALYKSLFPEHQPLRKIGRSEISNEIFCLAETEDLKQLTR